MISGIRYKNKAHLEIGTYVCIVIYSWNVFTVLCFMLRAISLLLINYVNPFCNSTFFLSGIYIFLLLSFSCLKQIKTYQFNWDKKFQFVVLGVYFEVLTSSPRSRIAVWPRRRK